MKKSIYTLLIIVMVTLLFTSCEHKELCYKHPHTTKVRIDVDWSKFNKYEVPTGMTMILYPQYSGELAISHLTNTTTHAIVNLPADRYHVLVFNQSSSEFGSISFRGMDKQETAEVVTNEHKSRWYSVRNEYEKVATDPEWLGVGNFANAEVTQEMIDAEVEASMMNGNGVTRSGERSIASITPVNIVHTVKVKVHINGIQNLRSARASLNGMAEGYRLVAMQPTASKATYLMENWKMTRDDADPTKGFIEASFTCFGLPDGHQTTADENLLLLSLLLVDNKTTMNYSFSVGDKFIKNTIDGNLEQEAEVYLELQLDINAIITLPDVQPEGGTSGGFDAEVEDWGEEEEIDIGV